MDFLSLFGGSVCDPNSIYYNSDSCGWGALAAFVIFIIIAIVVVCIIATAITVASRWVFFRKCGEGGWKAIIPVYNEITLLKVSGMNWWWIFILYLTTILSYFSSSFSSLIESYESIELSFISLFFSLLVLAASVFTLLTKIGMAINISKRFHKGGGYVVLILFFEPIMFFILGLSKNEVYDNDVKVSPNGIFGPHPSN